MITTTDPHLACSSSAAVKEQVAIVAFPTIFCANSNAASLADLVEANTATAAPVTQLDGRLPCPKVAAARNRGRRGPRTATNTRPPCIPNTKDLATIGERHRQRQPTALSSTDTTTPRDPCWTGSTQNSSVSRTASSSLSYPSQSRLTPVLRRATPMHKSQCPPLIPDTTLPNIRPPLTGTIAP